MENIDLSVLIAVYNVEKYLAQCLESVLCQTVERMEILVVDDGSTDHTKDILKKYENEYDFIKVISKKKNEGVLFARLDGMLCAKGQYITFLDADDTYEPYCLDYVLNIAKEKKTDIIEFEYQMINADNVPIQDSSIKRNILPDGSMIKGKNRVFELVDKLEVPLWKRFYSKQTCKKVIRYFTRFIDYRDRFNGIVIEDEFMFPLFLVNAGSYYYIEQKIYNYRFLRKGGSMYQISKDRKRKIRSGENFMYIYKNLSDEFRRKKLVSQKKYFEYKVKGINGFFSICKGCGLTLFDKLKIIRKYYAVWELICCYFGSKLLISESGFQAAESNRHTE